KARPRQVAQFIARLTRAAHLRPHRIERARGRDANLAGERHAAIAGTAHRAARVIDVLARDRLDLGFALEAEARPVARVGAARAAGLAEGLRHRRHLRPAYSIAASLRNSQSWSFRGAPRARARNP